MFGIDIFGRMLWRKIATAAAAHAVVGTAAHAIEARRQVARGHIGLHPETVAQMQERAGMYAAARATRRAAGLGATAIEDVFMPGWSRTTRMRFGGVR